MSGGTTYTLLGVALVMITSVGSYVAAVDQWYEADLIRSMEPSSVWVAYLADRASRARVQTADFDLATTDSDLAAGRGECTPTSDVLVPSPFDTLPNR